MLLLKNAYIYTMTRGVINNGSILVEEGKIKAVGETIHAPENVKQIDVNGGIVTPGLIDVHTHLGIYEEVVGPAGADGNELTDPATPHVRALDAINPMDKGFKDAYQSGITTVQVMPGSGNVIGGEMCVLKTYGTIVDEMVIKSPSAMKIAFGENPKRVYGGKKQMPSTRMGIAAVLRSELVKAQNYMKKLELSENDPEKAPERDLRLENLAKVLKRDIQVRAHAHRADDIVTALRIADEFNLDLTIEHCTEGHKIADFIKSKGVLVSVGPTMSNRSKIELGDKGWHTLPILAKHGIPFSITTDHPVVPIEHLVTSASYAVSEGLDATQALEALTINAAKHMKVDDRVGSIEEGKDADLVIWTGDPLHYMSKVQKTIINGQVIFER